MLRQFTKLAFSWEYSENEVDNFEMWATEMIQIVVQLEKKRAKKLKKPLKANIVWPKLHFLTHYSQLTRLFGPLVFWSTLNFERKHQVFKNKANTMQNFVNPAKSFMSREQVCFSLDLAEPKSTLGNLPRSDFRFLNSLTKDNNILDENELRKYVLPVKLHPHPISTQLIFKINQNLNSTQWINPSAYYKDPNGSQHIYVYGHIYTLDNESDPDLHQSLNVLIACDSKFVILDFLNHQSDFLFKCENLPQNSCYLINGVI